MPGPLNTINPQEYGFAPLRGVVIRDVPDAELHPQGILDILKPGYTGEAKFLANLAAAPSYSETDEVVNPFEGIYGRLGNIVGEHQIQSVTNEVTVSLISLSLENIKLLRPDFSFTVYNDPVDGITPIGVRMQRTMNVTIDDYVDRIVLALSTSEMTIGRVVVLENVINVADERSYALSEDLEVFGVEATLRAHSDESHRDPETGLVLPAAYEITFGETAIPA